MSFHADFMLQLRADVASALAGVGASQVYEGRRPKDITHTGVEVWIEPQPTEDRARGGGNTDQLHTYRVHVRTKQLQEEAHTGELQVDTVKGHLETLRQRWNGANPFISAISTLVALSCTEGAVDEDPDNSEVLDGYLELRALEKAS